MWMVTVSGWYSVYRLTCVVLAQGVDKSVICRVVGWFPGGL